MPFTTSKPNIDRVRNFALGMLLCLSTNAQEMYPPTTGVPLQPYTVGVGGVKMNTLVQFDGSGNVVAAATGYEGIAMSTASSGSTAQVDASSGSVWGCVFENAAVTGNIAIPGTTTKSYCRDSGVSSPASISTSTPMIGTIQTPSAAGATASVRLFGLGVFGTQESGGSSGLADPGANGIVKRTATNTTGVAVAGTDYQAPLSFTGTGSKTASATAKGNSGDCVQWTSTGDLGDAGLACGSGGSASIPATSTVLKGTGTAGSAVAATAGADYETPVVINVLNHGLVEDGATDNTAAWNTLMSSVANGSEIHFPCLNGLNYNFSSQMVFKGELTYVSDGGTSQDNNCRISSSYTAGTPFFFAGADTVSLRNLYLQSTASPSSPPAVVAQFGWTSSTSGGTHYFLDHVTIAGPASKALVYSIGSEEWTDIDSYFLLASGGAAAYVYYTSAYDDLSACSSCVSNSNTDARHFGFHWTDNNSTGSTHATVGFGSGGDMTFANGYITCPGDGGSTTYGSAFSLGSTTQGVVNIQGVRAENCTNFATLAGTGGNQRLVITGNTMASTATGATYFVNGSTLTNAINNCLFAGNTLMIGSNSVETYLPAGVSNMFIDEDFPVLVGSQSNAVIHSSATYNIPPPIVATSSLSQPNCTSANRGQIWPNLTGTPDMLQVCGRVGSGQYAWENLIAPAAGSSAPTVSVGAGAGTSPGTPTVTSGSTLSRGQVTVITGTSPNPSSTLATVTFSPSTTNNAVFCSIVPANASAATLTAAAPFVALGTSTTGFSITTNTTAPAANTSYSWTYYCF